MLSNELESCLNAAFQQARAARQELLTVDHLLLAILHAPRVREILAACRCDLAKLEHDVKEHLKRTALPRVVGSDCVVQPAHDFQRVLQRAVFHARTKGEKEFGVTSVLIAVFSEKQSHAVCLLNGQHITRLNVINYVSHGLIPD